ncbi:MAG: hypothetical protein AAF657_16530 [Acidobacteriota bacterium]
MGLIQDVGGKLVQSFLSLDDLVLGQGLFSEGLSQFKLSGRSVASSVAVGSNLAARTVHAGIQVGAKTAKATAGALEGFVPGAGLARSMAERVDEEAAAAGEEASQLAAHAVELASGDLPRSPLTKETWLSKGAPRGYGWSDLAADTAIGTFGRLATMPLTLGIDSLAQMAGSRGGRMLIDTSLKSVGVMLEMTPGASSTQLDTSELRESLMAVTASSSDSAVRGIVALAEAAARLAFGDTRKLHQAVEEAIDQMRLLAAHGELGELLPAVPISVTLRARARRVVDHAPSQFLAALERDDDGAGPSPGQVLSAVLNDADNLRIFATEYPLVLTLMGTNTSLFLTAGMVDVNEIEGYVQADDSDKSRPWSAAQLEAYVGKAPQGTFFEPTVHAAQDAAFTYSSEVLGRRKALARAERLYGAAARERLENDVSLDAEILNAGSEARDDKIRQHIAAAADIEELNRQRDCCEAQLASLEAYTGSLYDFQPKRIGDRKEVLLDFLSLVNQDLALREANHSAHAERMAAKEGFDAWVATASA